MSEIAVGSAYSVCVLGWLNNKKDGQNNAIIVAPQQYNSCFICVVIFVSHAKIHKISHIQGKKSKKKSDYSEIKTIFASILY